MKTPPPPLLLLALIPTLHAAPVEEKAPLLLRPIPDARYTFRGPVGERIAANIDQWLLTAPAANPGMLSMFRQRDRQPPPALVPWAGEFAGKYLISCVQALRLSPRDDLRRHTTAFVSELLTLQAEDGYLGPFPKDRRLLGEWDLWGHYHLIQGLLHWHDLTGHAPSLAAARRIADLVCRTYHQAHRSILTAGSPEMNMAISHALAELHRRTGEPLYWQQVQAIMQDWERAGDYLRTGLAGTPFHRTPLPRWESLHDLQTLVEHHRLTASPDTRRAFISHWNTIRDFDLRNTGAFSGGEQATGNPYAPTPIETCCTVAWMALSVDMLTLTADPTVADHLELATLNGGLGAQHPTGRWWTYNTPMDGHRKASAHDIVFQARPGTPELNCCSVNGPRIPGMLADWALMQSPHALHIHWHGPLHVHLPTQNITLESHTTYPATGDITWHIQTPGPTPLHFRIPHWATGATARINTEPPTPLTPGTYLQTHRHWQPGDTLTLHLPMPLRTHPGQREQLGKLSLYRGPLLLAWDQADTPYDETAIPPLNPATLPTARTTTPTPGTWLRVEIPTTPTTTLTLRDFATAGTTGTPYRTWLPTTTP